MSHILQQMFGQSSVKTRRREGLGRLLRGSTTELGLEGWVRALEGGRKAF